MFPVYRKLLDLIDSGISYNDVGKEMGFSRQRARELEKTARKYLNRY